MIFKNKKILIGLAVFFVVIFVIAIISLRGDNGEPSVDENGDQVPVIENGVIDDVDNNDEDNEDEPVVSDPEEREETEREATIREEIDDLQKRLEDAIRLIDPTYFDNE